MEIALLILSVANTLLFLNLLYEYRKAKLMTFGLEQRYLHVVSVVNLNADNQAEMLKLLNNTVKDLEFFKIVTEIHSEALKVRSPLGALNANSWPTAKVEIDENFGEQKS